MKAAVGKEKKKGGKGKIHRIIAASKDKNRRKVAMVSVQREDGSWTQPDEEMQEYLKN